MMFVKKSGVFLIMFIMTIALLSFSSGETIFDHPKNTPFDLTVTSNNATGCNLSYIQYPNGIKITQNLQMVKDGHSFSLSVSKGNYSTLGITCHGVICTDGLTFEDGSICRNVTPTGYTISAVQISAYIFFLLLCSVLLFFSVHLIKNNKMSDDKLTSSGLYDMKKRNEFIFYLTLLKRKMWIAGIFGVYISILVFLTILNELIFALGLMGMNLILKNVELLVS